SSRDRSGSPTRASSPAVGRTSISLTAARRYAATVTIEVRPARPAEYEEPGRVTALAYREFADSDSWDRYLQLIADVGARADIALVLAAFDDGRVLGSATLELDERIEDGEPDLPPA